MIIICDFGFRRSVGKSIGSGFFRFALLFGKPFLFGTFLGFQSFGFRLASCFRISIRRGCFLYRYRQAHGYKITLSRMVAGDEILLFYFRAYNQFGFHTVGADLRRGKVLSSLPSEFAVAIDIKRQLAVKNCCFVAFYTFQQAGKLCVIAIPST